MLTSNAEVGSSKINSFGFNINALAIAILCLCPVEILIPFSPIVFLYLPFLCSIKSAICAFLAACLTELSLICFFVSPNAIFSAIDCSVIKIFCPFSCRQNS